MTRAPSPPSSSWSGSNSAPVRVQRSVFGIQYTTNLCRPHSKYVSSTPSRGFCGPENISSLTLGSTTPRRIGDECPSGNQRRSYGCRLLDPHLSPVLYVCTRAPQRGESPGFLLCLFLLLIRDPAFAIITPGDTTGWSAALPPPEFTRSFDLRMTGRPVLLHVNCVPSQVTSTSLQSALSTKTPTRQWAWH